MDCRYFFKRLVQQPVEFRRIFDHGKMACSVHGDQFVAGGIPLQGSFLGWIIVYIDQVELWVELREQGRFAFGIGENVLHQRDGHRWISLAKSRYYPCRDGWVGLRSE